MFDMIRPVVSSTHAASTKDEIFPMAKIYVCSVTSNCELILALDVFIGSFPCCRIRENRLIITSLWYYVILNEKKIV